MGVYIDIDKPKECKECPFFILDGAITDDNEWISYSVCDLLGKTIGDADMLNDCPLIEIIECKDCKWFELDVWGELNGIPLIVAHEMCKFWGNGCKTNPNGFCSYGERRADEHTDKRD